MKNIYSVRLNKHGFIKLPKTVIDYLCWSDSLTMLVDYENRRVTLKSYAAVCRFCGGENDLRAFGDTYLCELCRKEIANL